MSILVDKTHASFARESPARRASFTRSTAGHTARRWSAASCPAAADRPFEGVPVFNTVPEAVEPDRGRRHDDLRAAPLRRRRHHGGRRRRPPLIVAITEGIPVLDMVRVDVRCAARCPAHRAQLPRHYHPRAVQDRHHARLHPSPRADRRDQPLGHADLRGGVAAHQRWGWASRRASAWAAIRSSARRSSTLCRLFQSRSGHRGRADDGRDRRHGRGGSGGLRRAST